LSHNDLLLEFIGKTKNNKTSYELLKLLSQNRKHCSIFDQPMNIIDITNPFDNEILGIGASIPNDLILDNFGIMLNGYIGLASGANMTDIGGTIRALISKGSGDTVWNNCFQDNNVPTADVSLPIGTQFKLGDGSVVARSDFDVDSPLPDAPENALQNTIDGGWNSGLGRVTTSRAFPSATGSGTISEIGLYTVMSKLFLAPNTFSFMITHDLVTPNLSYSAGQIINVETVWQF